MKHSIRTKFTLGMIFLFIIILVLSFSSGYFLNNFQIKQVQYLRKTIFR